MCRRRKSVRMMAVVPASEQCEDASRDAGAAMVPALVRMPAEVPAWKSVRTPAVVPAQPWCRPWSSVRMPAVVQIAGTELLM